MSLAGLLCALLGPIPATMCLCLLCRQAPLEDLEVAALQRGQAVVGCERLSGWCVRERGRKHRDRAQIGDEMPCWGRGWSSSPSGAAAV